MRGFQSMRWFRFPWLRRETAQTETSPLIPKVQELSTDTDRELSGVLQGSEDSSTEEQAPEPGPNDGPENQGRTREVEPRAHSRPFSLSDCLLKYLLFFSNLLFTMLGLLVLALGLWDLINKESLAQEKIGQISTDPMLVFVMLGLVFSATVLVLVVAQVLAAILAYSLQRQIEGYLRSGMLAAMVRYQDDLDLRFIKDEIQIGLQCCGADNYRDWEVNMYYNCSAPGVLSCGVPASCCVDPLENGTVWNSQCGVGAQQLDEFSAQSVIFLGGCLGGMSRWIEQHTKLIGAVGIVLLGVQIITLFITTRLMDNIQWSQ
ncbi:unnamed protein product [Coregonus sp. 'balchen']|nr:unnamed protein product [Coregonus sp. 'balchen']